MTSVERLRVKEPLGTVENALAHAAGLLTSNPGQAEAEAREILKRLPDEPRATQLLGAALRRQGDYAGALGVLVPLAEKRPDAATVQFELSLVFGALGRSVDAIDALRRCVRLDPVLADARRALNDGRPWVAQGWLSNFLAKRPRNAVAVWMLADCAVALGRYENAEELLARCLELAPEFNTARYDYAKILFDQSRAAEALEQVCKAVATEPENPVYQSLKAASLEAIGEYEQALTCFAQVLAKNPDRAEDWLNYGHVLQTVGRGFEAVRAYRKSIALLPSLGPAYWSLANLKTYTFNETEIQQMEAQLARADLRDKDRVPLHFAFGKALEDEGLHGPSFDQYQKGATLRRSAIFYDARQLAAHAARSKATFARSFVEECTDAGCAAGDPIFIVGLPRSGSTLIEQILSSHSAVEGTMELPDIILMARRLSRGEPAGYPGVLRRLGPAALTKLGDEYLERTRVQRKLGRPFFIDKTPNNFIHIGFIHLILPNAKIIDARRDPMACGFSAFKHFFAAGNDFSYDLTEIGRYYVDYVALMDHFDKVLPGRVHRVVYERLVETPETEVRALLTYCGLPFEEACLRFHENARAVRTASSEQVRRPIYTDSAAQWRNYEPWLGPLKSALGR